MADLQRKGWDEVSAEAKRRDHPVTSGFREGPYSASEVIAEIGHIVEDMIRFNREHPERKYLAFKPAQLLAFRRDGYRPMSTEQAGWVIWPHCSPGG